MPLLITASERQEQSVIALRAFTLDFVLASAEMTEPSGWDDRTSGIIVTVVWVELWDWVN